MATGTLRMASDSTEERRANIVPKHKNQENNFYKNYSHKSGKCEL